MNAEEDLTESKWDKVKKIAIWIIVFFISFMLLFVLIFQPRFYNFLN